MKCIDWIKPDIYDDFQCKGSGCRRTCCAGWRITVSKSEYQDLKKKLNVAGNKTLQRLPEKNRSSLIYGELILEEQTGCSLQSDEGLCKLQLSFGKESLPDVCASFPRKGLRCREQIQVSLSPACERVLELLLEKRGPLEFVRQKKPVPSFFAVQFSGKNAEISWQRYLELQEFSILVLQAEDVSLDYRMTLLGIGLHQIDNLYKKEEVHKVSAYINQYLNMLSKIENTDALFSLESFDPALLLGTFLSIREVSAEYKEIGKRVMEELQVPLRIDEQTEMGVFSYSLDQYNRKKRIFSTFRQRYPYFLENLMVMLFVMEHWASLPKDTCSIWDQYMYACWVYSNLKLVLTACIEEDTSDQELIDICVTLFRNWIHNEQVKKKAIEQLHENGCDTPAHMAMLVQAG